MNKNNRVAVGLSGGVDSAVAAALLIEQGYEVIGIFMKFWSESEKKSPNACCSLESKKDARKIADQLGIRLYTLNMQIPFKEKVVDNFIESYKNGTTPNPCVLCNKFIKFGEFYQKAKSLDCQYIATGHYAISKDGQLFKSKDEEKDQSYFLYTLTPEKLKNIIFPVGGFSKSEIRKIASKHNLPVASKKESQDICFVPKDDVAGFLSRYIKNKPGKIVNQDDEEVGKHEGLFQHTLGQRTGLNINDGHGPYYVVKKDMAKNILHVTNDKNQAVLNSKTFKLKDTSWVGSKPTKSFTGQVKVRYSQKTYPAKIILDNKKFTIQLKESLRAIAPGQHCVIYSQNQVIGGGEIT